MPNLEESIAQWRRSLLAERPIRQETLDELESHLRETIEELVRTGRPESEAFARAVAQLGTVTALASEFQKVEQGAWLPVKVINAIGLLLVVAVGGLMFARWEAGRTSLLLAIHVFTVTLGYTATFLIGALGICFVGQRCFTAPTSWRVRDLTRVTLRLGSAAFVLAALGTVLGMIWAKAEWGRLWAWDVKELGASAVLAWQACFLVAHRVGRGAGGGVLAMSLLGNIVVGLAWFGSNMLSGLHGYTTISYWLLLWGAVVFHLAFFLIGLAPAGWLGPRRLS